jgi:hypothetical protein
MKTKIDHQSNLSSECWMIQIWGHEYCKACQYDNTKECGGKNIQKTGLNALRRKVPIDGSSFNT